MMRSMFSGVSGLGAHQAKMDVIGNNIANVNTTGYKKGRVTFKETYNQTLQGASAPQGGRGGTNPQQIGLGVSIGAMDTIHTKGAAERTDIPTDLMINGDGFFMVSDDESFLNKSYTRAGNFYVDRGGNLNNADGLRVLGYRVEDMGENATFKSNLEGLVISKAMSFPAKETSKVTLTGKLNSETKKTTDFTPEPTLVDDGSKPTTSVYKGILKDPSLAYNATTNPIVKYEANATYADAIAKEVSFQAFDKLGGMHNFKQVYVKIGDDTSVTPSLSQYQVETFYVKKDGSMIHAGAGDLTGASAVLKFDSSGKLATTPPLTLTVGAGLTNGAGPLTFDVAFNSDNIIMTAAGSTMSDEQDGYKEGSLDTFAIGKNGIIEGSFTNGMKCSIGKIALAKFKNPAGLLKTSGNMFTNTANSGSPIIGGPKDVVDITPATLEMSNVDLSKEFTDMITTQRGFQANAKIITTSDEMLQELVNLKR